MASSSDSTTQDLREISDQVSILNVADATVRNKLAERLAHPRVAATFWEDSLRQDILLSFRLLVSPPNVTIDIGQGHGVAFFINVLPRWRATLIGATWGPQAIRKPRVWKLAMQMMMLSHDLEIIETVIAETNKASLRAASMIGFKRRGRIGNALCYNKVYVDGIWLELNRTALGLPAKES